MVETGKEPPAVLRVRVITLKNKFLACFTVIELGDLPGSPGQINLSLGTGAISLLPEQGDE